MGNCKLNEKEKNRIHTHRASSSSSSSLLQCIEIKIWCIFFIHLNLPSSFDVCCLCCSHTNVTCVWHTNTYDVHSTPSLFHYFTTYYLVAMTSHSLSLSHDQPTFGYRLLAFIHFARALCRSTVIGLCCVVCSTKRKCFVENKIHWWLFFSSFSPFLSLIFSHAHIFAMLFGTFFMSQLNSIHIFLLICKHSNLFICAALTLEPFDSIYFKRELSSN